MIYWCNIFGGLGHWKKYTKGGRGPTCRVRVIRVIPWRCVQASSWMCDHWLLSIFSRHTQGEWVGRRVWERIWAWTTGKLCSCTRIMLAVQPSSIVLFIDQQLVLWVYIPIKVIIIIITWKLHPGTPKESLDQKVRPFGSCILPC